MLHQSSGGVEDQGTPPLGCAAIIPPPARSAATPQGATPQACFPSPSLKQIGSSRATDLPVASSGRNERAKRFALSNSLPQTNLSSPTSPPSKFVIPTGAHPNSCYAAPDRPTCAAFIKESRMDSANATNLGRDSGERSGGICGAPLPQTKAPQVSSQIRPVHFVHEEEPTCLWQVKRRMNERSDLQFLLGPQTNLSSRP